MTFKEIQELVKLINKSNLTEFKMKDGEFELSIRTKKYQKGVAPKVITQPQPVMSIATPAVAPAAPAPVPAAPAPAAPAPAPTPVAEETKDTSKYLEVKSPMVGTFYRSASPDKGAYVKVGSTINSGDVVCIVEAMKLFNEIESEVSGKIVEVLVDDASPVEYDQVLFLVDPS